MKVSGSLLGALLVASATIASPSSAAVDRSDNVTLVEHFAFENAVDMYSGGTEIASHGKHLYAGQMGERGGVHVFDTSTRKLRRLSFIPCPGDHTDVELVRPGLIAVSVEAGGSCGEGGIALFDVRNPRKPKPLGNVPLAVHTITVYPGKPIIYVSGGGFGRDGGREYIVDASNPRRPEVAASFQPNPTGCHDLAFYISDDEQLAVCVGIGEGQVWDVSDPFSPRTIGHIPVVGQIPHSVAISPDGTLIAIGEESLGECSGPAGALFLYDFALRQAPVLLSYYETPYDYSGGGAINYCSPNFAFVPKTDALVSVWGLGGMIVLDVGDPRQPAEMAHYIGTGEDITYFWGVEPHKGRIWVTDRSRGLDVLKVRIPRSR